MLRTSLTMYASHLPSIGPSSPNLSASTIQDVTKTSTPIAMMVMMAGIYTACCCANFVASLEALSKAFFIAFPITLEVFKTCIRRSRTHFVRFSYQPSMCMRLRNSSSRFRPCFSEAYIISTILTAGQCSLPSPLHLYNNLSSVVDNCCCHLPEGLPSILSMIAPYQRYNFAVGPDRFETERLSKVRGSRACTVFYRSHCSAFHGQVVHDHVQRRRRHLYPAVRQRLSP